MDIQTRRATNIDLSAEADFDLGDVLVSPSTRHLICGGDRFTLEPRVMQLLVVLAQARGEVVSRDELVFRCWNGVIVGENAINRAVSLLRAAGAGPCAGALEIETIKKVGYRLKVNGLTPGSQAAFEPPLSRRGLLVAAGAFGTVGLGTGAWLWQRRPAPPALARELVTRGRLAQKQGLFPATEQAIAFFTEAVKIQPDYADAWGALALSYRHKMIDDPTSNAQTLSRMIDGAAARALAADPDNADAHVARLIKEPDFGHWSAREQAYRALLKRFPHHWLLRGTFARMLYDVGRWTAGVPLFQANVARDPFLPVSRLHLAHGLWCLGRPQEAEQVCRDALDRWPKHARVWLFAFFVRALSGHPEAALAMAAREDAWPTDLPRQLVERNIGWARALASGKRDEVAASTTALATLAERHPETIPASAPVLAALGDTERVLALAERYFDTVGGTRTDVNPSYREGWRETSFLFSPPLARLRPNPRFAAITKRIGLDEYWRATGTRPDPIPAV